MRAMTSHIAIKPKVFLCYFKFKYVKLALFYEFPNCFSAFLLLCNPILTHVLFFDILAALTTHR